ELPFGRVEVDALHVPRGLDSQGGFKELIRHVRFVSHGWLPHSAATSHTRAYRFRAPQGFAAPGSRPPLTHQTTHSKFKRGTFYKRGRSCKDVPSALDRRELQEAMMKAVVFH